MKITRSDRKRRGFTLMELMVAMAITTIIVAILVGITGTAVDTWTRGRTELRAARQAKAMVDVLANDLESLVIRPEGVGQWLCAASQIPDQRSPNASTLVFFTAATDRYDGQIGTAEDKGGDVSCVGYQLLWKDPLQTGGSGLETFVLNRYLVNPDETFQKLLGQSSPVNKLDQLFNSQFSTAWSDQKNFVCENIYQFTLVFHVEAYVEQPAGSGTMVLQNRLVSINSGSGVNAFRITGSGLETDPPDSTLASGRLTAVEVSLSVLSDGGVNSLRSNASLVNNEKWKNENTYHYSKLIHVPRM